MIIDNNILHNMYIERHMTMQQVADKLGVSRRAIRKYLVENNISVRKRGFGFNVLPRIAMSDSQMEFFDGLMAGDGSICRRNSIRGRMTRGNDFLSCGFKHRAFAQYIVDKLGLKCEIKPYRQISDRYTNGYCDQFKFISENNIFFTEERDRWYPRGTKEIPSDFRFSHVSMMALYLGDGHLRRDGRIYISTESFNNDNLSIILNKLLNIGIKSSVTSRNQIYIRDSDKFLEFVGSCPVQCYKYKWK